VNNEEKANKTRYGEIVAHVNFNCPNLQAAQ